VFNRCPPDALIAEGSIKEILKVDVVLFSPAAAMLNEAHNACRIASRHSQRGAHPFARSSNRCQARNIDSVGTCAR
jgi:hypothetical protein